MVGWLETRSLSDTQEGSTRDAIDCLIVEEWLDGWRCDHYPILNKLATGANALTSSLRHTQSKCLPVVFPLTNGQQIQDRIAVGSTLAEVLVYSETKLISDSQGIVGDAIDIQ